MKNNETLGESFCGETRGGGAFGESVGESFGKDSRCESFGESCGESRGESANLGGRFGDFGGDFGLFDGEPLEHLVKILPNASPRAILNALSALFGEYAALNIALERGLGDFASVEREFGEEIKKAKQDLALRLMSEILSQE